MIRNATLDDVPALVDLGALMAAESPRYRRYRFSAPKLAALFERLIASDDGFLMMAERDGAPIGVMAATVMEHWMSEDRIACDFGLFIDPEHRGGMLAARFVRTYRQWARARGAIDTFLGISTGVHVEQTARFYKTLGLIEASITFEVPHV
ncbi:GNAT family N-acetyltransferase [Burkholderia sp. EMB26]|uniref:GNAT family N-acetyltransferase n=1 Tax=Burkholderia sp. EMB26 TaxID=2854261 RepID=UPI00215A774E|nr:GNAT family N-acetyltransferase [Burkholderia sp. EMB26]UVE55303.1 GNAT family N-acetyltransferase [Burkholderia sp. EMB26]